MLKVYFGVFVYLLVSNSIIAQQETFHIAGKVLADDYYCLTPINGAYIQMKGQKKGYIADSSGIYKIDNLKPGKYKLRFTCVSCFDYDTTIIIQNNSIDSLNVVLPMWYYKKAFTSQAVKKEIESGYPALYVYTTTNNLENIFVDPFWEKYKIGYRIFEKDLIENSRQFFSAPQHVLIRFNQDIFNYLDKTYGKEWRKEAPIDILGLDE
ncbi:MAG: carboxypeptidase-like regulatory domain-containing protein [Tannerella sp.]|jgi:hypothetical protein|nr:carboxypeptidase-like regulatory domain-containing protein [Tannerella sp.]